VCRRIDLALGRAIRERLLEHAKLELLGEDAHDCVVDARHGHEALALEFLEVVDALAARLGDLPGAMALRSEIDGFLERYGSRETALPSVGYPSWRDDPTVVYGLLKGLVAGDVGVGDPSAELARAKRAEHAVVAGLSRGWFGLRRFLKKAVPVKHSALRDDKLSLSVVVVTKAQRVRDAFAAGMSLTESAKATGADPAYVWDLAKIWEEKAGTRVPRSGHTPKVVATATEKAKDAS
jgi:hypothetical protein